MAMKHIYTHKSVCYITVCFCRINFSRQNGLLKSYCTLHCPQQYESDVAPLALCSHVLLVNYWSFLFILLQIACTLILVYNLYIYLVYFLIEFSSEQFVPSICVYLHLLKLLWNELFFQQCICSGPYAKETIDLSWPCSQCAAGHPLLSACWAIPSTSKQNFFFML